MIVFPTLESEVLRMRVVIFHFSKLCNEGPTWLLLPSLPTFAPATAACFFGLPLPSPRSAFCLCFMGARVAQQESLGYLSYVQWGMAQSVCAACMAREEVRLFAWHLTKTGARLPTLQVGGAHG